MKRVGFFGSAEEIAASAATAPHYWEPLVTNYLRQGAVVMASSSWVDDRLDEAVKKICQYSVRTDGEWIWPADLAYYVSTYHVNLPGEFLDHIASREGKVANLDEKAVESIADWLMVDLQVSEPGVKEAS
ncbi:hypothetical protein [Plantactinospora sonchi]|uniref:Uncharacterized protein n=1 Tax=Plantactinospora sonchi TaxID=1544735 RepID=A0ABU7RWU9_9ACTN